MNIIENSNKSLKERVGIKFKEARKSLGLTQSEVAKKLGVDQPIYQRFESGIFECNYEQLQALCKIYDISSDYLLELEVY